MNSWVQHKPKYSTATNLPIYDPASDGDCPVVCCTVENSGSASSISVGVNFLGDDYVMSHTSGLEWIAQQGESVDDLRRQVFAVVGCNATFLWQTGDDPHTYYKVIATVGGVEKWWDKYGDYFRDYPIDYTNGAIFAYADAVTERNAAIYAGYAGATIADAKYDPYPTWTTVAGYAHFATHYVPFTNRMGLVLGSNPPYGDTITVTFT